MSKISEYYIFKNVESTSIFKELIPQCEIDVSATQKVLTDGRSWFENLLGNCLRLKKIEKPSW